MLAQRFANTESNSKATELPFGKFKGKRLNSPNDIVVKSDGSIHFADPPYGIKPEQQELLFQGVFRLNPENGELTLLVDDSDRPNGLVFSPTNCAWGEDDRRTFFTTSRTSVGRIKLKIPGTK